MATTKDPLIPTLSLSGAERALVADQLERMLASPLFSQSRRYAPFLRHVVEKTLDGQEESLKERVLGVEVFGRAPDYDSNNDPVVRVTAGEVRKRIAQYYHDPSHQHEPWIDLPTGTYIARFRPRTEEAKVVEVESSKAAVELMALPEAVTEPVRVESARRLQRPASRLALASLLLVLLAGGGLWWWRQHGRGSSGMDLAWSDLIAGNSPTVITIGEPHLYPLESPKDELTARQHLRSVYVAYSDLQALLPILKVLDGRHGAYSALAASVTSLADLRGGPGILLGGLDNPWTMRAQQNLRYRLASDGNGLDWVSDSKIADKQDAGAKRWVVDFNRPYSKVTTDYAIVAHFRDPNTQEPTLIVAGLGENGTKAASEFVTDPMQLKNALGESLLRQGGNFEVVLTTEVINGFTGAPTVVAKETW